MRARLLSVVRRTRRDRRRDERGLAAVMTILMFSSILMGASAIGVDTARWWLEIQRVQKAADAASLGAVTYLPQDMASATSTAIAISTRNGFPNSGSSTVVAAQTTKPSQLKVTVCSAVHNTFGGVIGIPTTTLCRYSIADYTGPAPMGSPCNVFGNEPTAGGGPNAAAVTPIGTALATTGRYANCTQIPQLWATVAGPGTDKSNGDRYQAATCSTGTAVDGCNASKINTEYDDAGYFWIVRVQPAAVNKTIDVQVYDPAYVNTTANCGSLPAASNWSNTANTWVTDAKLRYSASSTGNSSTVVGTTTYTGAPYCTGDSRPSGSTTDPVITSFAVRQQSDNLDPKAAPVQNGTNSAPCIKQFGSQSNVPVVGDLTSTSSTYDDQLAQVFHNWYSLCRFTPTRSGDYYIQARTNVSASGAVAGQTNSNPAMVYAGNTHVLDATGNLTTGGGNNSFGLRAVTPAGLENSVSVSGYDRMPIFANAAGASSQFNLIRVTPGGAGKSISFSFFDVGDATSSGTVKVTPPSDATGSITTTPFPSGCKAVGGPAGSGTTLSSCSAPINNSSAAGGNNGHTETISIPIPSDYTCNFSSQGGCWYQVTVSFSGATSVTDVTTWTASIAGAPVRLIE